jgi:hypothetical protein
VIVAAAVCDNTVADIAMLAMLLFIVVGVVAGATEHGEPWPWFAASWLCLIPLGLACA